MALELSRRRFFGFLAAPAIVRASNLMPISVLSDLDDVAVARLGLSHGAIRALLLPSLATIAGTYPIVSRQWASVFGKVA